MKITKVTPIQCDGGWRAFTFVKVEASDGTVGYGECTDGRSTAGLAGCIRDLEPVLLGQDPLSTEKLYWDMRRMVRHHIGGTAHQAIAGIDNALWDLKGKILGLPVYKLLGGPMRTEVRVYWSHCGTYRAREHYRACMTTPPIRTYDDIRKLGEEVVKRGYTALKTNMVVPGNPSRVMAPEDYNLTNDMLELIVKNVATFREAVGPKVDICQDINFYFKAEGNIRIGKALEPYNLMWLEIDTFDPQALLDVKRSVNVPICSCESLYTTREFRPFMEAHAMDVCMIDVPWNGITQGKKMADLAEIYEIQVAPHNYYSHLSTFTNGHFCASLANFKILESDVDSVAWRDELTTELPVVKNGYFHVPDRPGIGCDLNEAAIAKHPINK